MALAMGCNWICKFDAYVMDLAADDVLMVLIGRLIRVIEEAILRVLGRSLWVMCVGRWWLLN